MLNLVVQEHAYVCRRGQAVDGWQNIDFVDAAQGPGARVAVELSVAAARNLVATIQAVLQRAEAGGYLPNGWEGGGFAAPTPDPRPLDPRKRMGGHGGAPQRGFLCRLAVRRPRLSEAQTDSDRGAEQAEHQDCPGDEAEHADRERLAHHDQGGQAYRGERGEQGRGGADPQAARQQGLHDRDLPGGGDGEERAGGREPEGPQETVGRRGDGGKQPGARGAEEELESFISDRAV